MLNNFLNIILKDANSWVFGSMYGNSYNDNSKYLFEYISRIPGQKAIWLTRNKKVHDTINELGYRAYYFYSIKGIYCSLIAKYVVISYSYDDVSIFSYLLPWNSKVINLFHGTPLKLLRKDSEKLSSKLLRIAIYKYMGKKYDVVLSTSEISNEKLNLLFDIPISQYCITGYPRNDVILNNNVESKYLKNITANNDPKKIILYMPTFRKEYINSSNFNLFEKYGFNVNKLSTVLNKNNAIFLIKLHYNDYQKSSKLLDSLRNVENIYIINNNDISDDIYPLLSKVDLLITDYSSIYFDFLLLDKPIIFACFDKTKYETKDRGFNFDYDLMTPGPKVYNWSDLCDQISICLEEPSLYKKDRDFVSKMVNKYTDNNNSKRAYQFITRILS